MAGIYRKPASPRTRFSVILGSEAELQFNSSLHYGINCLPRILLVSPFCANSKLASRKTESRKFTSVKSASRNHIPRGLYLANPACYAQQLPVRSNNLISCCILAVAIPGPFRGGFAAANLEWFRPRLRAGSGPGTPPANPFQACLTARVRLSEGVQSRERSSNNQAVHFVGALVGIYRLQIKHVPDGGVFQRNSIGPVQ